MKAVLKHYRASPRKVRRAAVLIKGRDLKTAESELKTLAKRSAMPLLKLLQSAAANARSVSGEDKGDRLYVKSIRVDKGITLKRAMPRAYGISSRINKRSSHVTILLGEREPAKKVKKEIKKS